MDPGTVSDELAKRRAVNLGRYFFVLTLALSACHPAPRSIHERREAGESKVLRSSELGLELLKDAERSASSAGAGPLSLLAFGSGGPGDAIDGLLYVPEGRCALVFARGTSGIEDLDLTAYGDDGSPLGVDEAPDDLPTLLLCPETSLRLFVTSRVAQGHGLVALGLQDLPKEKAEQVARAVGARNYLGHASEREEAWPGLVEALESHREELGGTWIDQRRVALPVDARVPTGLSVTIPPDRCLDALFMPGDDISQLEVSAAEPDGRIFARAGDWGRNRTLLLCTGKDERTVSLSVRPRAGRGLAIAALSTTRARADALDLKAGVPLVHLSPSEALPPSDTLPKKTSTSTETLTVGEISSLTLKEKGCLRLDFTPAPPLLGYLVSAWAPSGFSVGGTEAALVAPLFLCGEDLRLDAQATRRGGPLRIDVRSDPEAPRDLLAEPLAASRLLGRASEAGLIEMPSEIGKVHQALLSAEKLLRIPFEVPAAHCVTFTVGRGSGGYGISARMLEKESGLELDSSEGARSVLVRTCSDAEHVSAVLELRAVRGEAMVLYASRQQKLKP